MQRRLRNSFQGTHAAMYSEKPNRKSETRPRGTFPYERDGDTNKSYSDFFNDVTQNETLTAKKILGSVLNTLNVTKISNSRRQASPLSPLRGSRQIWFFHGSYPNSQEKQLLKQKKTYSLPLARRIPISIWKEMFHGGPLVSQIARHYANTRVINNFSINLFFSMRCFYNFSGLSVMAFPRNFHVLYKFRERQRTR